jgi:hypothetical protein
MKTKKKVITLDSDKLHSMLFEVEWDLADKTQELIKVLKTTKETMSWFEEEKQIGYSFNRYRVLESLENLLEKRMNVLSAQCLVYDEEEK